VAYEQFAYQLLTYTQLRRHPWALAFSTFWRDRVLMPGQVQVLLVMRENSNRKCTRFNAFRGGGPVNKINKGPGSTWMG